MKSWAASGGILALVLACGASCGGGASGGGASGTAGGENAAGSAGNGDEGGNGGSGGAEFVDCTKLGPEACATTKGCYELRARLVSSPPTSADEPVGCVMVTGCSLVNITARDPQGRQWAFPDTCIPAGWVGEGGAGDG